MHVRRLGLQVWVFQVESKIYVAWVFIRCKGCSVCLILILRFTNLSSLMQFSSRQHWMQRYHYTKAFYHSILSSPQNIVLQIADFGSARTLEHIGLKTEIVGTYAWMAPEVHCMVIASIMLIDWPIIQHWYPCSGLLTGIIQLRPWFSSNICK